MAKQLNVNLAFNADTSKAKAQIQELYQSLNNVTTSTAKLPITTQIQEAQTAAVQLKTAMSQAFDVNTGKLDLLKFNQSIKSSGTSLDQIKTKLVQIGPTGQQAFLSLAQSIAAAEIPAKRTSALLTNLGVTLKNTVKWQLSSSMLHGFMGAVQSAYGYAQNLNSSLNDIRIVTGLSADEMDKFAEKANKAAKSLSSSTLDYTNASLIYFQQGLDEKEVEERTNVTLKMANASGATAEKVSQQMTAVWNNFDDGSKSLEYYADVMTALGAATASSTDEISQGLQKFSAVASTVGLSYEYATSALATITATTRESADVVGTALKTLFARIQGLQQGDTLDDGTTLNKYSAALDKVGISIKDANGQMKDMDTILDEMGAKWKTLEKDQQLALAQTVAGVRQYTQLVALMDNWDFFEQNLDIANNAEGTLQEQADIYAESWEAARKRVKAAAEAIYTDLLDDKFFIGLTNSIEKVLTLFDQFLDSIGGARGVILGLSSILLSTFSGAAAKGIEDMIYNIKSFVGIAQKEAMATQNSIAAQAASIQTSAIETNTSNATIIGMQAQLDLTHTIAQKREQMTATQQLEAEAIVAQNQAYADQLQILAQKADTAIASKNLSKDEILDIATFKMSAEEVTNILNTIDDQVNFGATIDSQLETAEAAFKEGKITIEEYQAKLLELGNTAQTKGLANTGALLTTLGQSDKDTLLNTNARSEVRGEVKREVFSQATTNLKGSGVDADTIRAHIGNVENATAATNKYNAAIDSLNQKTAASKQQIESYANTTASVSQKIVKASQAAMSLSFAISQIQRLGSIWQDEDLSTGEKILQTFMALGTAVPMLINGITGLNTVMGVQQALSAATIANLTAEQTARLTGLSIEEAEIAMKQARFVAAVQSAAGTEIEIAAEKMNIATMTQAQMVSKLGISAKQAEIIQTELAAGASLKEALAKAGVNTMTIAGIRGAIAHTGAKLAEVAAVNSGVVAWLANAAAMIANQLAAAPLLVIILAIAAAIAAAAAVVVLLVKGWQALKAASPEGQLNAAKEATEGMTAAAEAANSAYQDLLGTINGYKSAVSALDGMTKGTQEYTNALIEANEKAWDLISTHDLVQGQDWDYAEDGSGKIVIKDEALNNIDKTARENLENMNAGVSAAKVNEAQKEVDVAKSNVIPYLQEDLSKTYSAIGLDETGRFESLMKEWTDATNNLDDAKIEEIATEVGKKYYGEEFDFATADASQLSKIYDMLWSGEELQKLQQAENNLNNVQQTEVEKAISNNLLNEQEFQDTSWKQMIIDEAAQNYNAEKAKADASWDAEGEDAKTADEVAAAFDQYLSDNGLTKDEDGKVYDKDNNEISDLSNLDDAGMRNILATVDALNTIESQAIDQAKEFNAVERTMSDDEKTAADALINGNINTMDRDQIESLQGKNELTLKDLGFDNNTSAKLTELFGEEKINEWLESLNQQIADWKPELFNTDSWQEQYAAEKDALDGVEMGDTISADDYAALGDAAKQYFVELADGTYRMIEDGNKVREIADQSQRDTLEQGVQDAKTGLSNVESNMKQSTGLNSIGLDTWTQVAEEGTMATQYQDDYINAVNEALGTQATTAQEAAAAVREYQSVANDSGGVLATMATSVTDLNNMLLNGSINAEQYQAGLQELGASYSNSQDELQAYNNALESGNAEAVEAAHNNLELATSAGELGAEYGYTGEEVESMAKQLKSQNKDLKTTGRAFSEMAKDQLRFNDALESANSSMDDWKDSIKAFKETGKLIPTEQIEEMREAYGNLLDIDGSSLSEEFLTSSENLEDMEKALNGDEEAYQRLQALAGEQILQSVGIDTSKYQEDLETLQGMAIDGKEWASIEAGASLNNQGFLDALTEMVNASGMTAAQATDYLSSMGVDAEVVEGETVTTTEKGPASFDTQVDLVSQDITVPEPDGSGGFTEKTMTTSFPKVTYTKGDQIEYEKETKGTGLKVISANKSSGGNVKSTGGGGSSGSSGGGGGGGSSSNKTKVDKVKKSSIVKRYKRVDDKIDDKQNAAEKASRAMDKLYGNSRIKQMQKYNQLLQEEIGLLEAKKQEAEDYLKIDQKDLQSTLDDALKEAGLSKSLDFKLDDDGLITNYEEIMTKLWAKLDNMITQVNKKGGATEDEQDQIDELQDKIDAVTEAIEQYDETRELIEDIENEMAEKALELYDNQLEALSYEIELNLEVSDDSLSLIEFQLGQIEDNAFKAAEAINLMGSQAATIEEKMAKTKDALASLTAMTLDGEYTEEQMELIKEYRDELISLAEEYAEIREAVEEQVITAFEGWREELDKGISSVEHAGSVLESYKNITDLLGDSISEQTQNELYSKLGEGIMNNAIDNIEATKAAYEGIQEAQARAQAEYDAAIAKGDEASAEMWKNTLNTLNEEAQAAQEAMLASWENALNAAVEQFEQSVERAVDSFREQFDDLSDKFSRQKETSDMFLDDYAKIYELSKLSRDINKTIDDTESLGGKKKLKGLLEDINKLQEDGVEMSQYDLEYLQKTYDLRLAELELENAQNAKNTVRLSKDNEGNWSYVYTTNTDAVDQAQQKYEDALYAMQDLSSNYIDEMSEKLISTSQEMADALAALRVEDFGSYQEYQDAVDAVTQEYENKLKLQEAELDKAIGNNKVLYETDWKNYSDATGYKISKTDEFVTAFRDSLLGSLMDSTTESSNFMEVLAGSAKVLVDSLGVGGKEYFTNVGAIMEAAGTSTDAFGEDATEAINATGEASKKAAEDVTYMADSMVDDFDKVSDAVVSWQNTYSEAITQALADTESLVAMINAMNESLVKGNGIPLGVSVGENDQGTYSDDNDITADIIKQLVDMDLNEYDEKTLSHAMSKTLASINVEDYDSYEEYAGAIAKIQNAYTEALQNITTGQDKEQYVGEWDQLKKAISADSEIMGELIPQTLAPILAEVIDKISINAQQMSLGVGQWAAQVIKDEFIQTLEQKVDISAEFPNVSDHNEIEQALTDLINTASQYANRK